MSKKTLLECLVYAESDCFKVQQRQRSMMIYSDGIYNNIIMILYEVMLI